MKTSGWKVSDTALLAAVKNDEQAKGKKELICDENKGTITVTGSATIEVMPDTVVGRIVGIYSARTAQAALEKAQSTARLIIQRIGQQPTTSTIRSSEVTTRPVYTSPNPGQARKIDSYEGVCVVLIESDKREALSTDVQLLLSGIRGASLADIDWELKDSSGAEESAAFKATQVAQNLAFQTARGLGSELGKLLKVTNNVTQRGGHGPVSYRESGSSSGIPIIPGKVKVSASVTVTYELVQ